MLLDEATLERLEGLLIRHRPDVVDALAPGLSDERMDELAASIDLTLGHEPRGWWGWHDGSLTYILPGLGHLSLEEAIAEYTERRRWARRFMDESQTADALRDEEIWWRRSWLPIFETGGQHVLVLECEEPDGPAPVRQIDWSLLPEAQYAAVLAPSLGEFLERYIAAIEAGRHWYDAEKGDWVSTRLGHGDP
jgi:cell wall assembly regulator SMI1